MTTGWCQSIRGIKRLQKWVLFMSQLHILVRRCLSSSESPWMWYNTFSQASLGGKHWMALQCRSRCGRSLVFTLSVAWQAGQLYEVRGRSMFCDAKMWAVPPQSLRRIQICARKRLDDTNFENIYSHFFSYCKVIHFLIISGRTSSIKSGKITFRSPSNSLLAMISLVWTCDDLRSIIWSKRCSHY